MTWIKTIAQRQRSAGEEDPMSADAVTARIRGEYFEMPGLRLTLPQACRLWQLDRLTCEAVLTRLIKENFLLYTDDGAYIRFSVESRSTSRWAGRTRDVQTGQRW